MRHTRIKLPAPASYHITTRVKNDEFLLEEDADKRDLLDIIRRTAAFSGITVLSYAILDNHFHLLVNIPPQQEIDNAELERRIRILWGAAKAEDKFERWQFWESIGKIALAEKERNAFRRRMCDISPFVKEIKQLFTLSYNRRHERRGTVWGRSRFKSAAVSSDFNTLATVATYIDLNAVRARIARHPKNYKWCGLGAAKRGDTLALSGLAALVRAAKCSADELQIVDFESALDEYMRFLDGTKKAEKTAASSKIGTVKMFGDTPNSRNSTERFAQSAQYIRKTLDSADLTKLGADGVARWLEDSEIKPEGAWEMWNRRFGNLVVGGIIGPLEIVLSAREQLQFGMRSSSRWQPGVIEGIYTFIHERNEKARKQNAS